jgi:hypothetical protein
MGHSRKNIIEVWRTKLFDKSSIPGAISLVVYKDFGTELLKEVIMIWLSKD